MLLPSELASAKSIGEICTIEPSASETFTKIMYVIDKSGSNKSGNAPTYVPTDPDGSYRISSARDFYQKHASNPYTKWGLITFQDPGTRAVIADGTGTAIFTQDSQLITDGINSIPNGDTGGTPYFAALGLVRSAILKDQLQSPSERSMYIVIFLSDGEPTDGATNDQSLQTEIQTLTSLGQVTLHTVYYGPQSATASGRMLRMAQWGGGNFLDTNVDGRIPLDGLIGFKTGEPWVIKKFNVTNINAAPCDDGTMDTDSDGDGLCDKDEIKYNTEFLNDPVRAAKMNGRRFDPLNRNSFSPYVSDAFFYQHIVFDQTIPSDCTMNDLDDTDSDLVNNCEERLLVSNSPVGPTNRWTNTMQKDGDPKNFDSDGDGYLDFFEFIMTRNRSSAMDRNNVSQLFLGYRLDTIFDKHLNWRNPTSSKEYDGIFRFSRVNERGQNCYSYTQTVLPLYSTKAVSTSQVSNNWNLSHGENENVIMISFIQTPEQDPNGTGELRYFFQKMNAKKSDSVLNLNLRVEEYQSYRVPMDARVNKN